MNKITIKNYNLELDLPFQVNIIGLPSSGKTTLLKMLKNNIKGDIYIDDINIQNFELKYKRKNIIVALHDLSFNEKYVKEELIYYQEKVDIEITPAYKNLDHFIKYFKLHNIIESKIEYLTLQEKALIKILSYLIIRPKIIAIDTLLSYLDKDDKDKIIKYTKSEKISILNVTSDSEELLLFDQVVIIKDHKAKEVIDTKELLNNEKKLLNLGLDLPFVVNISKGLNYYDVLTEIYYTKEELLDKLWK